MHWLSSYRKALGSPAPGQSHKIWGRAGSQIICAYPCQVFNFILMKNVWFSCCERTATHVSHFAWVISCSLLGFSHSTKIYRGPTIQPYGTCFIILIFMTRNVIFALCGNQDRRKWIKYHWISKYFLSLYHESGPLPAARSIEANK